MAISHQEVAGIHLWPEENLEGLHSFSSKEQAGCWGILGTPEILLLAELEAPSVDLWLHGLLSGFRTTVQQDSSASAQALVLPAIPHTVPWASGCGTSAGEGPSINELSAVRHDLCTTRGGAKQSQLRPLQEPLGPRPPGMMDGASPNAEGSVCGHAPAWLVNPQDDPHSSHQASLTGPWLFCC